MLPLIFTRSPKKSFRRSQTLYFIRNYVLSPNKVPNSGLERKMCGWQIHSYGDLSELQFSEKLRIPSIKSSDEILVKVKSSGVNPIDVAMTGGYGSKLLNLFRCNSDGIEFPLTLGREFSGVICRKGMGTSSRLQVGDLVWGVVPIQRSGCHAEYVVVPEYCVAQKPDELTLIEAGCMLYAGLTAWSGIFLTGQLGGFANFFGQQLDKGRGQRVLVLGASGGVGSAAVQILKAEQASVIASCSSDAIPLVQCLGADYVIDYTKQDEIDKFTQCGPYDIILDCAGLGPKYAERFGWSYKSYITFTSPFLRNVDEHGIPFGVLRNITDIIESNAKSLLTKQALIKWAYFVPCESGIEYLSNLVRQKKFRPLIDSTFDFNNTNEAYAKVQGGHLRGKVVVNADVEST